MGAPRERQEFRIAPFRTARRSPCRRRLPTAARAGPPHAERDRHLDVLGRTRTSSLGPSLDWGTWGSIGGAVEIDERSRRGASAHRLEAMCRSRGWEVASYRPAGQLGWGVHNEDERGLFRQAAGRVLAGHGLMTIAKDWNHRGVLERRVKLGRRRRYESCCSPPASPGCASTLLIGRGGFAAA